MRAICESCAKPQPVDWRPGDLCGHCGLAVREEQRCYWCAKWSPKGKFCRKCGAVSVAHEHYGPARMLKSMGASVFEIPKLLAELDPELIATHDAIYKTHLAAANRHIEYARELSGSLCHKHWAAELEEQLTPQLPWNDGELEKHARGTLDENSPVPLLQDLTLVYQMHRGEWKNLKRAANLIYHPDATLAAEAALQLSGWRALCTTYTEISRYDLMAALRPCTLTAHVNPRLAMLGAEPRPEYGPTGDPDTDFLVMVLNNDVRALITCLDSPDPMRRYAAALQLVRLKEAAHIGPALLTLGAEEQTQLLRDIARGKAPAPMLHDALFRIFETTRDNRASRAAAQVIAMGGRHVDAVRLLELSDADRDVLNALLRAKLAPETLYEIGWRLVKSGRFTMDQWGWDQAAKPGGLPVRFVEEMYPQATPEVQKQLLRLAEMQIEAHAEERSSLERFLIRQCFVPAPVEVMGAAWASIHRIQMHREVGRIVPCEPTVENVAWCWTMPEFLTRLAELMANPAAVRQTFVRDDFDRFLRRIGDAVLAEARTYGRECEHIREAAPKADPYIYAVRFAQLL